jgi:hypothetical protein
MVKREIALPLVSPPRFNLVRRHGVLALSATWRSLVIPESDISDPLTHPNCPARKQLLSPGAEGEVGSASAKAEAVYLPD